MAETGWLCWSGDRWWPCMHRFVLPRWWWFDNSPALPLLMSCTTCSCCLLYNSLWIWRQVLSHLRSHCHLSWHTSWMTSLYHGLAVLLLMVCNFTGAYFSKTETMEPWYCWAAAATPEPTSQAASCTPRSRANLAGSIVLIFQQGIVLAASTGLDICSWQVTAWWSDTHLGSTSTSCSSASHRCEITKCRMCPSRWVGWVMCCVMPATSSKSLKPLTWLSFRSSKCRLKSPTISNWPGSIDNSVNMASMSSRNCKFVSLFLLDGGGLYTVAMHQVTSASITTRRCSIVL